MNALNNWILEISKYEKKYSETLKYGRTTDKAVLTVFFLLEGSKILQAYCVLTLLDVILELLLSFIDPFNF